MINELEVDAVPVFFWQDIHQFFFHLNRIAAGGPADSFCDAEYMGIYRNAGNPVGICEKEGRRLAADARQFYQLVDRCRNFSVLSLPKHFAAFFDTARLHFIQADAFDGFFQLFHRGLDDRFHIGKGGP